MRDFADYRNVLMRRFCGPVCQQLAGRAEPAYDGLVEAARQAGVLEVWTTRGLQRMIVLFFLELATRKVEIAGIAANVNGLWMQQIGRNLTDAEAGLLRGKSPVAHRWKIGFDL